MLQDDLLKTVQPQLRALQIMAAAMVVGLIVFGVVTNVLSPWTQATMDLSMLPLLGAAASFFSAILAFVMPALVAPREDRAVDAAPRSEDDVKAAVGRFAVGRIIRFAILEGGCFLNLVVYLLDHSLLSLVVAGIGLFLLMLSFPTAWAMRRAL